jgi:transcriptional antiterminator Rof (Rho-off)
MKQDSPLYPVLIQSIIDNMNLSNREELIATMQQASQPNPQAQQMAMMAQQSQMELQQSQTNALNGQAAESQARAAKLAVEAQIAPQELEIDRIQAVTKNLQVGDADDKEFDRRLKVADRLLKEREVEGKSKNANDTNGNQQPAQPDQRSIQGPDLTGGAPDSPIGNIGEQIQ